MRSLVLIADNVRSCENVGSLMRTAEGLGVERLYLSGYTPYPKLPDDTRPPHIAAKLSRQIHKTALGAELSLHWQKINDLTSLIKELREDGYLILALEQAPNSVKLPEYSVLAKKIALVIGNEVKGLDDFVLKLADQILEIPMLGQKESFNVTVAAAIALYRIQTLQN